jgi:hypothetical protein
MSTNNFEQRERKSQTNIRMINDFTMGILWSAVGLFLLLHKKLGYALDFEPFVTNLFGGICILYGGFRIWRGIKAKSSL